MSNSIMEWDELNLLRASVSSMVAQYRKTKNRDELIRWCDYMEYVLCLVYAYGWQDAEEIVGVVPFKDGLDDKAVNLEIKGETFRDRVFDQMDNGKADPTDEILRIIDTEAHRDYNTGVYDAGKKSNTPNLKKRWNTRLDDKVRDAHAYLEGVTVGMDDEFYTYTGDSALYPGGFGVPDLDINCRCTVSLVK